MALPRALMVGIAGLAVAGRAAHKNFNDPALLVALPAAIAAHTVLGSQNEYTYKCPKRAELHKLCTTAGRFDSSTIVPVNQFLDKSGNSLTDDALHAIRNDITHTNQMSSSDSIPKYLADVRQQAAHQRHISAAFSRSGEHEGAFMHKILSGVFDMKAKMTETIHTSGHHFTSPDSNSNF